MSVHQRTSPDFFSFFPRMKTLHLLITLKLLFLVWEHSSLSTIFFVFLAFFLKIGLVCPPNPFCFISYLLLPWATREALPLLYWETLWVVCFFNFGQKVLIVFGI